MAKDGVNLKRRKQCSIWPILISVINLPPWIRMRSGFLLLAGVIPHRVPLKPREKLKRNFDGYLQIVANELKVMNEGFNVQYAFIGRHLT